MKVTTINNEVIDKILTRKIKNLQNEFAYYKIGVVDIKNSGDCYQINGIYYTNEKGRIVWDEYLKQYVLKTSTYEGIINSYCERGYFSKTVPNIAIVFLKNTAISEYCMSIEIAESLGLINGEQNLFYNPNYYNYEQIIPRQIINQEYKKSLLYNFKDYIPECVKNFENFKIIKNDYVENVYKQLQYILDFHSFGIELETTKGMIPEHIYKNLGVRPVRDGSISGLEYVTIPLNGKKGLYAFVEIINAINKYTSSDYTCSMHIHVGNVPRTKEFIVAMFKTMYYLQNEMYRLFPSYKQNNLNIKRQCYTAPLNDHLMTSLNYNSETLEKIKEDYQKIVYELSSKHPEFKNFIELENINSHPCDPSENSKWNIKERYKILNIIPLIFTNKQTIEYRIFTVPDTLEKAIFFLTLALSTTNYVVNNIEDINISSKKLKNINFVKIFENTLNKISSQYDHLGLRQHFVNQQVNYKGAFFEEKDIIFKNY